MQEKKDVDRIKKKSTFREYAEAAAIAVLLALFIRTFVVQAFKIPSGSMKPTLLVGDHILVNKFIYGVKIPFLRTTLIPVSAPERGDIIVFIYPVDPSKDFIKRGDRTAGGQDRDDRHPGPGQWGGIPRQLRPLRQERGEGRQSGPASAVRTGGRSGKAVLRHGGQSRPQLRQQVLGLCSLGIDQRKSLYHLLVLAPLGEVFPFPQIGLEALGVAVATPASPKRHTPPPWQVPLSSFSVPGLFRQAGR